MKLNWVKYLTSVLSYLPVRILSVIAFQDLKIMISDLLCFAWCDWAKAQVSHPCTLLGSKDSDFGLVLVNA